MGPRGNLPPSFVQTIFDEETIYSICSRMVLLSGRSTGNAALDSALASIGRARQVAIPVGLDGLEIASGGQLLAGEDLLRNRTILGVLFPVLPHSKRSAITSSCRRDVTPRTAVATSGLDRSRVCATLMKFCQACVDEEWSEWRTSIWRTFQQLPGIWLCIRHSQTLRYCWAQERTHPWMLPHDLIRTSRPIVANVESSTKLIRLLDVISWIRRQHSLDTSAIKIMIKDRLRAAGLVRSEIKWQGEELSHLNRLSRSFYRSLQIPDVQERNESAWFPLIMREPRLYHPLSWAMGLAWVGLCSTPDLHAEYLDAKARKPQADLFGAHLRSKRRIRAPKSVYDAFQAADRKSQAQSISGLDEHEISAWLRKDAALKAAWSASHYERRRSRSMADIRAFLQRNPGAKRVDVLRACHPSYRWLQANDLATLTQLLPDPVPHLARQGSFDFTGSGRRPD